MRPSVLALLVLAAMAGCSFYSRPSAETPFAPVFDDARAAREGQALRAAPSTARRLAQRLGEAGFQPITRPDRRYVLGADTVAAAFLPGKDAVRAGRLVVVAVSEGASPAALGGFAELARTMGRLSRSYLLPEPTVLFASLPRGREQAALAALTAPPVWPADSVQAVVIAGPDGLGVTFTQLPVHATAGATAQAGYALLRDLAYAHRSRAGATGSR